MLLQQFGGPNALGYYAGSIFVDAGKLTASRTVSCMIIYIWLWGWEKYIFWNLVYCRFFKKYWDFIAGPCEGNWLIIIASKCGVLLDTFPKYATILLQIPAGIVSVILTDKSGRRPLLIVSMTKIQLLILFSCHWWVDNNEEHQFLQVSAGGMFLSRLLLGLAFCFQVSSKNK